MITDFRASQMFLFLHKAESVASIARRLRMSGKTVRKYRDADQLPSQIEHAERSYRTREDPLTEFWDEITALLERDPLLKPYAILDWLKQKYNPPEGEPRVSDSIRRTLERRVQSWKLQQGIEQEVKFPQTHHPGDVIAFDFVVLNSLKVTLAGKHFDHMLFHAVFTYSNWEYVHLCHSESFEALSTGLQDALHRAGGVPRRVRSDSLSAAVNNLSDDKEFATAYRDLLGHYGVQGHRINVRKPHENGDVESSHRHFKDILDQALRLRGSRDFANADDYMAFVCQLARRRNDERAERFREEIAALGSLPAQRRGTSTSILVPVKSDSIIRVKRNAYSVSSKYIGLQLEVRIHQDHLELWYRNECLERMPRLFGCGKEGIDFRHVIDSLIRKPGAFVNYKYVNHMYPTTRFRMAYDQLLQDTTEPAAVKQYLKLLYAAKHEGLDLVDDALRWFLTKGQAIKVDDVLKVVASKHQLPAPTAVHVEAPDLSTFDSLLQHKEVYDEPETNHAQEPAADDDEGGLAAYDRHVEAAGATERVASADVPRDPPVDGRASGPRTLDAHAVPGGTGRQGMSDENAEPHCAIDARCESVGGQDLGALQLVSVAAACDPAIRDASSGGILESTGQLVDLRETRLGKNDALIGTRGSTRETRAIGLLCDLPDAGAGVAASQARSPSGAIYQEAPEVRSVDHRRLGLRPAESRGDGGVVHVAVGTLRTWQCAAEFEPALFQVGADLQGSDDDRCSDRPLDSSLGHHRAQHPQLPTRRGQEETTQVSPFSRWIKRVGSVFSHMPSNCR
jgi:transposase